MTKKPVLLLFMIFFFVPFLFSQEWYEDDEFPEDWLLFAAEKGITVTGTLQTTQQMAVIDRKEIEKHGAADIATLLQETLDLNITRYGVYGNMALINLRGFDSKRLAFLIDGVPVNSSMDGKFDIEQIDTNSIERIEVIYGGSDSKFNVSGALGGVINIVTVKKQDQGLRLGFSVSNTSTIPGKYRTRNGETDGSNWEDLLDTQNFTLSAAYGKNNFSVTANAFANRAENHFLFTDRYEYTRRKDNNEVQDAGAGASMVWELPDLTKLIASANFYYSDKNIPSSGFSSNIGKQEDFSLRSNLMLDMPIAFRDDLAAEASLGWHFVRRDYTSPADQLSSHDQQNITLINRWAWYSGEKLTMRSGYDFCFIFLNSTEVGNRNRQDSGVYLTAEYKPVQQFMVIPSVKAVFTSEGGASFTAVPKLGFLWNVTESFALKNNWFRSFKFPDFEDLYWAEGGGMAGNSNLRPEDGCGVDLCLEWRITEQANLESSLFTQWTKDSIHWSPGVNGIWRPENAGEAAFFGLDSKLKFEIPVSIPFIKKMIASVSYKYLLSYLLSYGYDFTSNKRIPYSPAHTIGSSADFLWESGSFAVSCHYESRRFSDTRNLSELKPYFLLNANVNQQIGNISLFGTLRNILNTSYESFYDYPMPGITLTIGFRANYKLKGVE